MSYEAVLVIYRGAVARKLETTLTERFPQTWQRELGSALRGRLEELKRRAADDVSAGTEPPTVWEMLEPSDFPLVIDPHFSVLLPDALQLKDPIMRRVRLIAEERNALVHRPGHSDTDETLDRATAVFRMDLVRQVLRAFGLRDDAARVHALIADALGLAPTIQPRAEAPEGWIPTAKDYWRFYEAATDRELAINERSHADGTEQYRLAILFGPLMQFCEQLVDELSTMADDDKLPVDVRFNMHFGVENVVFALQDILLNPPWGSGRAWSTVERLMRDLDDPPAGAHG